MNKTLQEWAGPHTKIVVLVFTDIIDSTSLGNRIGDERWIQLLEKHFSKARGLMEGLDCCEVKLIGDSFMVAFRTAPEALDFALAFHKDTGDFRIKIRVGIHVGPVRIINNDMYGRMVNYTKRVEGACRGPVIVLSDEAKKHVESEKAARHSSIFFRHYQAAFKGFDQPQLLWEVVPLEKALGEALGQMLFKSQGDS